MRKIINLIGKRFGRLVVNKYIGQNKWNKSLWLCKCDCGNEKIVPGSYLSMGWTKSCGCLYIKHGHSIKKSPTYSSWKNMKTRCTNQNRKGYKNYGGRKIKVCKRWSGKNGFINFLKDMGERPLGLSLDRINNNKSYFPKNCRWATRKQQNNNKRNNKR